MVGFPRSEMEPCLFIKDLSEGEKVYLVMWVDDCLQVGKWEEIDKVLIDIRKHFKIVENETLDDYLSCKIKVDQEGKRAWIGQPHLIKKLELKLGELVQGTQSHKTPGTPIV